MNFKRIVSLFVSVCIICSAVFTLVACKDNNSDAEPTESDFETESVSEDVETDLTGDKWVSEFVDTTVEDGSVVYKTTKKHVEGTESVAELAIHCFKNDVEQGNTIVPREYVRKYEFAARNIDENEDYIKGFLFGTEYNWSDVIRFFVATSKYQNELTMETIKYPITDIV